MMNAIGLIFLLSLVEVLSFGTNCGKNPHDPDFPHNPLHHSEVPSNLHVAYIGDVGVKPTSRATYELIREFQADFVVHSGDFDYNSSPSQFYALLDQVLGPDMPYFASIGNHETSAWDGPGGYQDLLMQRLERQNLTQFCTGDFGTMQACFYQGILFTITGPGTRGSGHADFIDQIFSTIPAKWKVCSWHKNQRLMQIETKSNETGWPVYEVCNDHGAMVVTGHAHVLCRTHVMSSYEDLNIAARGGQTPGNPQTLNPGETFMLLSGISGQSIRASSSGREENPWWAVSLASTDSAVDGCYLCVYNIDGQDLCSCEFVDINGHVWDKFYFTSKVPEDYPTKADRSCEAVRIERQVSTSQDDIVITAEGDVDCQAKSLSNHILLSFNEIQLSSEDVDNIEYAFLELHGASDGDDSTFEIAVLKGSAASQQTVCKEKAIVENWEKTPRIFWLDEHDDWDLGDVWVSPDISTLIKEVISTPDWTPNGSLKFELKYDGLNQISSFDENRCIAPSLVIQMKKPKC